MTAHLKWPPHLTQADTAAWRYSQVEQDTLDDIRQSVALLCEIRPGQLPWAPDTGTPSLIGTHNPDEAAATLQAALSDQEPRAVIHVTPLAMEGRTLRLQVAVTGDDRTLRFQIEVPA